MPDLGGQPGQLLQSAVPNHLNAERLRHLELACLRSDIIIVDEADRVQMQLDTAFAPSATLIVRGPDSWLDRLGIHKIDELARQGRLPLSARDVERWSASLDLVHVAANRLYRRLITDHDLRRWADIEYFSAWTLQEKLVNEWYPRPRVTGLLPNETSSDAEVYDSNDEADGDAPVPRTPDTEPWDIRRNEVTKAFDAFRDDPLGDRGSHSDLTDAWSGVPELSCTTSTRQRPANVSDPCSTPCSPGPRCWTVRCARSRPARGNPPGIP